MRFTIDNEDEQLDTSKNPVWLQLGSSHFKGLEAIELLIWEVFRGVRLERSRMSPQARVARMSDEALAAEIDRLFPAVVAGLMQGSEVEQAFCRTIIDKRAAELTLLEQQQLIALIQSR